MAEFLLDAANVGAVRFDAEDAVLYFHDNGFAGFEAHLFADGSGDDDAAVFIDAGVEEAVSFDICIHNDIIN